MDSDIKAAPLPASTTDPPGLRGGSPDPASTKDLLMPPGPVGGGLWWSGGAEAVAEGLVAQGSTPSLGLGEVDVGVLGVLGVLGVSHG